MLWFVGLENVQYVFLFLIYCGFSVQHVFLLSVVFYCGSSFVQNKFPLWDNKVYIHLKLKSRFRQFN